MKHIKINLTPEEALVKLQNKETLIAYTEGYEQDTRCAVYNEKNRLVIDWGDGRSEDHGVVITKRTKNHERIKKVLSNIKYVLETANKSSKADEYTIEINALRDHLYGDYDRLKAFDLELAKNKLGFTGDDLEYYLDELRVRGEITFNDNEYYYC